MASLSPQGERAVLALVAEQYAELVDLREALAAERQAHATTAEALHAASAALSGSHSRATPEGDGEAHSEA